jgi:cytochrome c biogenesis protein CcdA
MEWIEQVLKAPGFSLAALPAALLLGLLTAVASCCNVGIIGAVAGFAGSREETLRRRDALSTALFFMVGTVISLAVLGLLVGHISGLAGTNLRRYGIAVMGLAVIFSGLVSLKLLPFRIPSINLSAMRRPRGAFGSAAFGLAVGAAGISCTLACSGPLLPIVFGMAAMKGQAIWSGLVLGLFAVGYSLPLTALMLGVGLGRTTALAQKALVPIRLVGGIGLIVVGFWLLATI